MDDELQILRSEIDNLYAALYAVSAALTALRSAVLPLITRAQLDENDYALTEQAERMKMAREFRQSIDASDGLLKLLSGKGDAANAKVLGQILEILKAQNAPRRILRDADGKLVDMEVMET